MMFKLTNIKTDKRIKSEKIKIPTTILSIFSIVSNIDICLTATKKEKGILCTTELVSVPITSKIIIADNRIKKTTVEIPVFKIFALSLINSPIKNIKNIYEPIAVVTKLPCKIGKTSLVDTGITLSSRILGIKHTRSTINEKKIIKKRISDIRPMTVIPLGRIYAITNKVISRKNSIGILG